MQAKTHVIRPLLESALSHTSSLRATGYYQPTAHRIRSLERICSLENSRLNFSLYTVVVVGVGGLGSHAVLSLADLGFNLLIIDPDTVESSNCHRQNYTFEQVGQSKVLCAFDQIRQHFPLQEMPSQESPLQEFISPHTPLTDDILPWIAALQCRIEDLDFSHAIKTVDPQFVRVLDLCDNDNTRMYVENNFLGWPILQCRLGTTSSEVHYIRNFVSLTPSHVRPTPRDQTTPRYSCLAAVGHIISLLLLSFDQLHPGIYTQNLLRLPNSAHDMIVLS